MICKFALVGILLLASSTLAVHPSQPEVSLDHRDENLQSESLSRVESRAGDASDTRWTYSWAGSLLSWESFDYITATLTIPTLSGSDGAAVVLIGIDPLGCESGSLEVGIQGNITSNEVSWVAWHQWLPSFSRANFDVTVTAGDVITVTVIGTSTRTGRVIWENYTTRTLTLQEFNTTDPLCMMTAGWFVEPLVDNHGKFVSLADFSNVTFTHAMASAPSSNDTYLPSGPSTHTIYGIKQNGVRLTSTDASGSTLVVLHA